MSQKNTINNSHSIKMYLIVKLLCLKKKQKPGLYSGGTMVLWQSDRCDENCERLGIPDLSCDTKNICAGWPNFIMCV